MEAMINNSGEHIEIPGVLIQRIMMLLQALSGARALTGINISELDEETLLNTVLKEMIQNLDLERCSIFLLQEDTLVCAAGRDWQDHMANEKTERNDSSLTFQLGEGLIGMTAKNRQLCYSHNCKLDERFVPSRDGGNENPTGSLICAPIMAGEELLGVLNVSHPDPNFFNAWQEHIVLIHANILGIMIHSHRLLQDMQTAVDRRTKELEEALEESEKLRARFEEMSVIDHLTKLYNRRFFFTEVNAALAGAIRHQQHFCLMLMDLDHFKEINDDHGHDCGDMVLKDVSDKLNEMTREGDILARFGGEEFVFALPNTEIEGAVILAERIRKSIDNLEWECSDSVSISISIGIAELHPEDTDVDKLLNDMLRQADRALYHVKQHGRNQVLAFRNIPTD